MRQWFAVLLGIFAVGIASAAQAFAGEVIVKGPHICCSQCVKIAKTILSKVDGVSDANADAKSKTVTFKAASDAAAEAGVKALIDGGFFGTATNDGKEVKIAVEAVKKSDAKAATVSVKDVHVCCGACKNAIKGLFKDSKVSYEGTGPQLTVIVAGADLDSGEVLLALRKAGFNGTLTK